MTELDALNPKKWFTPRNIARFVVGSSVRFVVTTTITALVPTETKIEKVKVVVGSYVIAALLADKAKEYIGLEIDEIMETVNELKAKERETESNTPNP